MYPFRPDQSTTPMNFSPFGYTYQEPYQMSSLPPMAQSPPLTQQTEMGSIPPIFHIPNMYAANPVDINFPTLSASARVSDPILHEGAMQQEQIPDLSFLAFWNQDGGNGEQVLQEPQMDERSWSDPGDPFRMCAGDIGDCNEFPFKIESADDMTSCDDFLTFIDQGCEVAEDIAMRNHHRPCFRYVPNMCSRTRTKIHRPFQTINNAHNIHMQGISWVTKDLIYAYMRLIGSSHLLRGYMQLEENALPHIDHVLTHDFRNCYGRWENATREMTAHMTRIFTDLDTEDANSSPPVPNSFMHASPDGMHTAPSEASLSMPIGFPNYASNNTDSPDALLEALNASYGDASVRKYSADSTSPAIEFAPTARNISVHYRVLNAHTVSDDDDDWKTALAACNNVLKTELDPDANQLSSSREWPPLNGNKTRPNQEQQAGVYAIQEKPLQQNSVDLHYDYAQQLFLQQQTHQQMAQRQSLVNPLQLWHSDDMQNNEYMQMHHILPQPIGLPRRRNINNSKK